MPNNCDAACVKIILNGGFVAILAERLANAVGADMQKSARRLSDAARAFVTIAEHAIKYGALTRVGSAVDFKGCDQASALATWSGTHGYAPAEATEQMDGWADEYEAHIRAIVSGGAVTERES